MVLIMPETQSLERRQSMQAYGAELVLVSKEEGMEGARDLALAMQAEGRGRVLDQFSNDDNWRAHYRSTGPEIWRQTAGSVTHFVSAMGTTGTITGVSRFLKEQRETIRIIGAQPAEGASIAGIRAWPPGYEPAIRAQALIDRVEEVSQQAAEDMTRRLAREEGIFCGVSSGGAAVIALRVAEQLAAERSAAARQAPTSDGVHAPGAVEPATVVFIVCDRGDRYLSTGLFAG